LHSCLFCQIWLTFILDKSLTSKLFWAQGQHQVKLLNGVNITQGYVSECLIDFRQGLDAKFTDYIAGMIPENGIGIMDRGFVSGCSK